MDIIRKRRDALIAKAKASGERSEANASNRDRDWDRESDERTPSRDGGKGIDGRCHGCGVGATHEWRTGPDGPRSLCDSCGVSGRADWKEHADIALKLHYAKLIKSRISEKDKDEGSGPSSLSRFLL